MIRKKGFTLLELMVTLSIFLILSVMISAILIQSQRILASVDNSSIIQNEVRNALLKIQTEAQNADEVIINNKFGAFDENKWILNDSSISARELLRIINNEEDISKVYVEVNDGDKHQLIEFTINKLTNEIVNNSKNVLISNIEGNDANTISLKVEEIKDSKGKKINELVTINCSNVINGNKINESDYLISFTKGNENEVNIGNGTGNDSGNSNSNNVQNGIGSAGETGGEQGDTGSITDGNIEVEDLVSVQFNSTPIIGWQGYSNYEILITNNTSKSIENWELIFEASDEIINCWHGNLYSEGNGVYKIASKDWNSIIKSKDKIKIEGQCKDNIKKLENLVVNFSYKE